MVVGTIQEEDCNGLCWQNIIKEDKICSCFCSINRTYWWRYIYDYYGGLEIRVDVSGISCHCSTPERGDNAIYKIEDIFQDVTSLNKNVSNTEIKGLVKMLEPKFNKEAETTNFLGKGIVTVSQIGYTRPRFVQLEMDVGYHLIEEWPQEKNLNHIFKW